MALASIFASLPRPVASPPNRASGLTKTLKCQTNLSNWKKTKVSASQVPGFPPLLQRQRFHQGLQILRADPRPLQPISARPLPVRIEVDKPLIAVFRQRVDLALPVKVTLPQRLPNRLVVFQRAVLGMDMR